MSKRSIKKTKNKQSQIPSQLRCTRLSYEVWKNTAPDSSYELWARQMCPDNILLYLKSVHDELERSNLDMNLVESMSVATLDDEYLAWLEQEDKEDDASSRLEYAASISEEDLLRLMRKNKLDISLHGLSIPLLMMSKNGFTGGYTNITMSGDTHEQITTYLKNIYKADVLVLPYYVSGTELYDSYEDFRNMALAYFDDGVKVDIGKYRIQKYENEKGMFTFLHIPFFVLERLTTPTLDMKHLIYDENGAPKLHRIPEMAILDNYNGDFAREFYGGTFPIAAIEKDFAGYKVSVSNMPCPVSAIPKFELKEKRRVNHFMALTKNAKQKKM